jgi:hypothetical protein
MQPAPALATPTPGPESARPSAPPRTAAPTPAAPPQPAQGASRDKEVDLFGRPIGTPEGGPRLGHDAATPPSMPPSAPRLDALNPARTPDATRPGSTSVLNLLPPPPEKKSKLATDIEKAAKPDCRQAYSGMGLLAAVPLAADAVRGKGCKW